MDDEQGLVAIDAHVHLHDGCDMIGLLRRAGEALRRAEPQADRHMVLLACRDGHRAFRRLRDLLPPTVEPESLLLGNGSAPLVVAAGRQIVTAEKLEILALGSLSETPDGWDADRTILTLLDEDAIVVLPWGAGKWTGTRGKLVDRLLRDHPGVRTGDIGGRPRFWPVRQFAATPPMLSGTDNLPLPRSGDRVGRFGSLLATRLSDIRPVADLKRALRDGVESRAFGRHRGPFGFLTDQIGLRIASRWPL